MSPTLDLNILIGGEAGQGMQTLGLFLTQALLQSGYFLSTCQSYQSRIRGGHNTFQIRVSDRPVRSMTTDVNLLVALDANTLHEHLKQMAPKAMALYPAGKFETPATTVPLLGLDIAGLFPEAAALEVLANGVYLGALAGLLKADAEIFKGLVDSTLGKKSEAVRNQNRAAFDAGYGFVKSLPELASFALPTPPASTPCLAVHGNEALALGALAAGCKFYTAYPMTPSTSVLETLSKHMHDTGAVVEQAEDEIAALNMALGAAYAGVRAATGTSGGGFSLMVEALSLAGITETPVVIVLAQRPGPATGLPTRTEQGDLGFALHAGHGEFARVVLAPGDPAQCFEAAWRAFNLAEQFQVPVIILTDQYLADWYTRVEPFDLARVSIERGKLVESGADYARYAFSPDGISPRALPGRGQGLVVVDSDEHTEDGHLTEDLEIRQRMADKRNKKMAGLRQVVWQPQIYGQGKRNLILCWGSNYGVCRDAVEALAAEGRDVALMHFAQLWPLDVEALKKQLAGYINLAVVENNATGQLAKLIRSETSLAIEQQILKYDGLPFMYEELLEKLKAVIS